MQNLYLSLRITHLFCNRSLSINALRACVYSYIRQLSSFRAPTLWFIDLTVATCLILARKRTKHEKTRSIPKWPPTIQGAQSINTEQASLKAWKRSKESVLKRREISCRWCAVWVVAWKRTEFLNVSFQFRGEDATFILHGRQMYGGRGEGVLCCSQVSVVLSPIYMQG